MPLSSFYQISFCPLGRSSDPIPCIVGSHPVWGDRCRCCCRYSTSSHPSPLLPLHQRTAATVCWLNSREATILQPRQSRLHRWVTIKHESDYSCLWNWFFFFVRGNERHRLLRLCGLVFWITFCACLLVLGSLMCAFSPAKHAIHSNTYTHAQMEMPEGSGGISRGLIRAVLSFVFVF